MPKVDFYSIPQPGEIDQQFFACRLVEKIYKQGLKIYIHAPSEQAAQNMDDLLWSFREDCFIPHAIVSDAEDQDLAVLIGYSSEYSGPKEVLINLHTQVPDFHHQFQRITEIVPNDEAAKAQSREHWNLYKKQGFELQHNKL